jgi:DNA polymerase theta
MQPDEKELAWMSWSLQDGGEHWLQTALEAAASKPSTLSNSENEDAVLRRLDWLTGLTPQELVRLVSQKSSSIGVDMDYFGEVNQVTVRDGLRASEGFVLLAADYCQVELRLLTHFSGDRGLCAAFHKRQDVFKTLAAKWRGKTEEEVLVEERTLTKQVCYALIYGAGPALVSQQAGVTEAAARNLMGEFLNKHHAVKTFIAQTKKSCRRLGYVQTLLGRR